MLEAVLVKTKAGSAWTVRFGAKGNDDDEVIVAIALDKLHEMSLARSYSLAEIRALTDVTPTSPANPPRNSDPPTPAAEVGIARPAVGSDELPAPGGSTLP